MIEGRYTEAELTELLDAAEARGVGTSLSQFVAHEVPSADNMPCDMCGDPATKEVESLYLCTKHFRDFTVPTEDKDDEPEVLAKSFLMSEYDEVEAALSGDGVESDAPITLDDMVSWGWISPSALVEEPAPTRTPTPRVLFAYGIFRNVETFARMCGGKMPKFQGAVLRDWKRFELGCAYVVPATGYEVYGTLYEGVTDEQWAALDEVEGVDTRHYDRVQVRVRTQRGRWVDAQVYRAGPRASRRADHMPEVQW